MRSLSTILTLFAVAGVASFIRGLCALIVDKVPIKVIFHEVLWVALVHDRHPLLLCASTLCGFSLPLRVGQAAGFVVLLVQVHSCQLLLPLCRLLRLLFLLSLLILLPLALRKLLNLGRFVCHCLVGFDVLQNFFT